MKMKKIVLCALAACLLCSCSAHDTEVKVESTNMGDVMFCFDGLQNGERASFLEKEVDDDHYPIFCNGSVLDADVTFYYDGLKEPYIDLREFLPAICDFSEISGEGEVTIKYAIRLDDNEAVHDDDLSVIKLTPDSAVASVDGNLITLSAAYSASDDTIALPYTDAAKLLGFEAYFYDSGDVSEWGRNLDTNVVEQKNGAPYYISGTPHLMFWSYPENAEPMTAEEAVEAARDVLIKAYENNYGTYEPLTEEEAEKLSGEAGYYNTKIQNLTVTSENDRFYRIPFVYDFLIDKYTGDIITQYNGMAEVFRTFDPYAEGALTFAG